jgi:hypothetical protein
LSANKIWVLPATDGSTGQFLKTDGGGTLSWAAGGGGSGDVTSSNAFTTDNVIIRSDGTGKGVQNTGITINDLNNVSGMGTLGCGAITSSGNLAVTGTITGDTSLTLDGITITTAEITVLDSVTAGTATASKAVVLDTGKNIAAIGTIGCGAITSAGVVTCWGVSSTGNLSIGGTNKELRFYEGSNYIGFKTPALSADQIWVLPATDGDDGSLLGSDGDGNLSWLTPGGGPSDIRLKKNIVYLDSAIDKIIGLKPCTFVWKKDETNTPVIGFIAQDVETVIPEAVFINENSGMKGLYYNYITATIIKGMQDQQDIINKQKEKIEAQKSIINKNETEINTLKNQMAAILARLDKLENN